MSEEFDGLRRIRREITDGRWSNPHIPVPEEVRVGLLGSVVVCVLELEERLRPVEVVRNLRSKFEFAVEALERAGFVVDETDDSISIRPEPQPVDVELELLRLFGLSASRRLDGSVDLFCHGYALATFSPSKDHATWYGATFEDIRDLCLACRGANSGCIQCNGTGSIEP